MRTYRFRATLRCHLCNGETQMLNNFEVAVEADTRYEAGNHLKSVATEMVHDRGGDLIDAPMDYLEVVSYRIVA